MSHVVSVNVVITDLAALEAACKELSLQFMRDQKKHAWWGQWANDYSASNAAYIQSGIKPEDYGKCEHAIKVPGSKYEIGVYKNPKGKGFILAYDNYSTGHVISEKLGVGLEKLKQLYAANVATMKAKANGWMVNRKWLPNGALKLELAGM